MISPTIEFYAAHLDRDIDVGWYLELNKGNEQRGRWKGYRSAIRGYARMMVDLEQDASGIYQYQTEVIPGLLQTERYMREKTTTAQATETSQRTVDGDRLLKERQQIITRDEPPDMGFVLSESAIRRTILEPEVMREQKDREAGR